MSDDVVEIQRWKPNYRRGKGLSMQQTDEGGWYDAAEADMRYRAALAAKDRELEQARDRIKLLEGQRGPWIYGEDREKFEVDHEADGDTWYDPGTLIVGGTLFTSDPRPRVLTERSLLTTGSKVLRRISTQDELSIDLVKVARADLDLVLNAGTDWDGEIEDPELRIRVGEAAERLGRLVPCRTIYDVEDAESGFASTEPKLASKAGSRSPDPAASSGRQRVRPTCGATFNANGKHPLNDCPGLSDPAAGDEPPLDVDECLPSVDSSPEIERTRDGAVVVNSADLRAVTDWAWSQRCPDPDPDEIEIKLSRLRLALGVPDIAEGGNPTAEDDSHG